jgi:hypothetical protein
MKKVKLNESQLRRLVRGIIRENYSGTGTDGTVAEIFANSFFPNEERMAMNALEAAGFDAQHEMKKQTDVAAGRRSYSDPSSSYYSGAPVIRVTMGGEVFSREDIVRVLEDHGVPTQRLTVNFI